VGTPVCRPHAVPVRMRRQLLKQFSYRDFPT
jgi:hypothetical protein